jgi:hypothetical protein
MLQCVRECVDLLRVEGYAAWDPQLNRVITPADLDAMIRQYREVDPVLLTFRQKEKKPWWKFW